MGDRDIFSRDGLEIHYVERLLGARDQVSALRDVVDDRERAFGVDPFAGKETGEWAIQQAAARKHRTRCEHLQESSATLVLVWCVRH
jgi:hypothetical protein